MTHVVRMLEVIGWVFSSMIYHHLYMNNPYENLTDCMPHSILIGGLFLGE
jgi:hypothetical protein